MNVDGKNPCDVCKAKDKASGCNNCVLDQLSTLGECYNDNCMLNYECGCLLSLDNVCKASTCYEDDYRDHECGQCVHFGAKPDKYGGEINYCKLDDDVRCDYDMACSNFEEKEG